MGKVKLDTSQPQPELKVDWRKLRKQKQEWKKDKELKKATKALLEEEKRKKEEEKNLQEEADGVKSTVSVAIPGSILDNAQSSELRSYLIGQIARACVIFNCDEIVVYDEYSTSETVDDEILRRNKRTKCIAQMVKVLQYLECPQYLRKYLFPIHEDLQYAGLLNPLDTPHHLKETDESIFREGVVTEHRLTEKDGCYVNVGLRKEVLISQMLRPGLRVTLELEAESIGKKKIRGKVIAPDAPRRRKGLYWGYSVRIAPTFSAVFMECPYDGGYDLTIGTSERGKNIDRVIDKIPSSYKHCLIVFGGLKGIEAAIDADEKYSKTDDASEIFNFYINTCPFQGSNTIRTEEAILITLSSLRPYLSSTNSNKYRLN